MSDIKEDLPSSVRGLGEVWQGAILGPVEDCNSPTAPVPCQDPGSLDE